MKKFIFTLQPLLKVKQIQEKQKKVELAESISQLNDLYARKVDLSRRLEDSNKRYQNEMREGMPPSRVSWYTNFADYIRAEQKALLVDIAEAQTKKEMKQAELVSLTKEIKTIENLREEQYRAYLNEAAKEEERMLGDLISYNKSIETQDSSLEIS